MWRQKVHADSPGSLRKPSQQIRRIHEESGPACTTGGVPPRNHWRWCDSDCGDENQTCTGTSPGSTGSTDTTGTIHGITTQHVKPGIAATCACHHSTEAPTIRGGTRSGQHGGADPAADGKHQSTRYPVPRIHLSTGQRLRAGDGQLHRPKLDELPRATGQPTSVTGNRTHACPGLRHGSKRGFTITNRKRQLSRSCDCF